MAKAVNHLLLFADLVGSTEVAVEASPICYSRTYVASFHWAARCAYDFIRLKGAFKGQDFKSTIAKPKVAGDEVLSFTPMPVRAEYKEDAVASAVAFAYVTKLFWLVSPYNLLRVLGKQFPRDVAVGIHMGPVVKVPCHEAEGQVAGLHINIAKRIETSARDGKESRIFASYEVMDLYHRWVARHRSIQREHKAPLLFTEFKKLPNPETVKGIPKPLQLFELRWNQSDDSNLVFLLEQLHMTPQVNDVDLEKATAQLMEVFLPPGNMPFVKKKSGRQVDTDWKSNKQFIKDWFEGIDQISKLFFDEYWLVISSYWVSCGMLRHPAVKTKDRESYVQVTTHVCDRLRELAALSEPKGT